MIGAKALLADRKRSCEERFRFVVTPLTAVHAPKYYRRVDATPTNSSWGRLMRSTSSIPRARAADAKWAG